MSAVDLAVPRLKLEEGFRSRLYKDTQGHQSIGFGFDVDAGITPYEAEELLRAQVQARHEALESYAWYLSLDEPRQTVLIDISFNAGLHGLVDGFPKMIEAVSRRAWTEAAAQCHVSEPELAARYARNAHILLTGEIP
jgi:GH24 family phage-related lysozyme (muramidase)